MKDLKTKQLEGTHMDMAYDRGVENAGDGGALDLEGPLSCTRRRRHNNIVQQRYSTFLGFI